MTLQRNHYEVLGVPRTATTDDIKTKYRELARKFHPDIAQDKIMGQKIFSQINQAYRVLGDPVRRAEYDAGMAAEAAAPVRNGAAPLNGSGSGNGMSAASAPNGQTAQNVTRLLGEAETAMLQGNIGKVKSICELVLKSDPGSQKAMGLLGDAYVQMGKSQEAAALYRHALKIAPNAVLQAKLSRLQGGAQNGHTAAPANGAAPRTPPAPPTNNNGAGAKRTDQGRAFTDQGRSDKPSGGLFGRLLGKK